MLSNGKRKHRSFSEQFKRDAVNLVVVEGYSFAAAARAVNVAPKSLREWHEKYAAAPETCVDDAGRELIGRFGITGPIFLGKCGFECPNPFSATSKTYV